jgi:hypothetical protein
MLVWIGVYGMGCGAYHDWQTHALAVASPVFEAVFLMQVQYALYSLYTMHYTLYTLYAIHYTLYLLYTILTAPTAW